jgi:hypothetical protein
VRGGAGGTPPDRDTGNDFLDRILKLQETKAKADK